MNHVLLTLQMMDDWADWEQDLSDGSYNCLLSLIKSDNDLPRDHILSTEDVHRAVYLHETLNHYVSIASTTHLYLTHLDIHAPHVISFHEMLVNDLINEASNIEKGRKMLEHGGLNYFLSILNKI